MFRSTSEHFTNGPFLTIRKKNPAGLPKASGVGCLRHACTAGLDVLVVRTGLVESPLTRTATYDFYPSALRKFIIDFLKGWMHSGLEDKTCSGIDGWDHLVFATMSSLYLNVRSCNVEH